MHERSIRPANLGITRLLWIFAILSVALLGSLAFAPARSQFTEWRSHQEAYNRLAKRTGTTPLSVALQQVWKPDLGVVDRCPSCHVGTAGAEPIPGNKLFAAHPPSPHDSRDLGCTVCHAGQGRATNAAAAHGNVPHWHEPLLERRYTEAGCGTCHSHIRVPPAKLAVTGRRLFEQNACRDCHRVNGIGRGDGPDLSHAGLKGWRPDWHARHVELRAGARSGPWTASFAPLAVDEVAAVGEYLRTLVGAPRLVEGKLLAHQLGCRGCHRIAGVGGDDGPDLSDVGRKVAADLDFTGVRGPRTLASWLFEHFLDPATVVPGSQMPAPGLTVEQADLLTLYMLSLRKRPIPEALAPKDRVRAMRLGERDFPTDGASLYAAFCAACHGPRGEGRRFGNLDVTFPAIGGAEFLSVADDAFLRRTLIDGRPGRRMPAWGTKDGGLRAEEIDALVRYLRSLEPAAPPLAEVLSAPMDVEKGRRLYIADCATCHGAMGEGSGIAPPLAARDNPVTRDERRIYETLASGVRGTAMSRFRGYGAAEMRAILAAVSALPPSRALRSSWKSQPGDARRGAPIYARSCAGCHGPRGEGKVAPGIGTPAFLAAATDGYLKATIVRGRPTAAMPRFGAPDVGHAMLSSEEVADVVAFLRSLSMERSPQDAR